MKTLFHILLSLNLLSVVQAVIAEPVYKRFILENPPEIGVTKAGQKIGLGGISAMHVVSESAASENPAAIEILAVTDRGPNAPKKRKLRPFPLPDFQPRILRLRLDRMTGKVQLVKQILLRDSAMRPFTGLPPFPPGTPGRGDIETPVDLNGKSLPLSELGIDPEGLCVAPDTSIWISDEYGPDLFHFTNDGVLIEKLSPGKGLPTWVIQRPINNGFEGLACEGSKVFALLQTPLEFPNARNKVVVRLLEVDTAKKETTGVYIYELAGKSLKLGDLTSVGAGKFLAIEQNGKTGRRAVRDVYEISLAGATNILNDPTVVPEQMSGAELREKIKAVTKRKILNLAAAGFDVEKAESVAQLKSGEILVGCDNDFGIDGDADFKNGRLPLDHPKPTQFGLFNRQSHAGAAP